MKVATWSALVCGWLVCGWLLSANFPAQLSAQEFGPIQQTYTSAAPSVVYSVPSRSAPVTYSSPTFAEPLSSSSVAQTPTFTSNQSRGSLQSGLAQSKASRAAQMGLRGHLGGGLGGARYEGVGWSSQSAQQAIEQCCYWGQRPTAQIGVAKGPDGLWYACVLYH